MNVKPGDLAIVVSARTTPEMVGRIVKVERAVFDGEIINDRRRLRVTSGGPSWLCSAPAAHPLPQRDLCNNLFWARERAIADRLLRPISGLPMDEPTETEKPIEELA